MNRHLEPLRSRPRSLFTAECNHGHVGCWTVHPRRVWRELAANVLGALIGLAFVLAVVAALCAGCGGEPIEPAPEPVTGQAGHCPGAVGVHCITPPPPDDGRCPGPVSVLEVCEGRYLVDRGQLWSCALLSGGALGCWDPSTLRYGVASCDVCEARP